MKTEEVTEGTNDIDDNHDPHFEPIISLPEVKIPTMEEEEELLLQMRAKLFRYDLKEMEWKERGTGEVKILHHEKKNTVRIVMRREKTLKLCANHYITPEMELKPNKSCERAWVWKTEADFADEVANSEVLAIKFLNSEMASKWKTKFDEAKEIIIKGKRQSTGSVDNKSTPSSAVHENGEKAKENGAVGKDGPKATCKEDENGTEEIVNRIEDMKLKEADGEKSTTSKDEKD